MSKQSCDGCSRRVYIGGGRGNLWRFDTASPEGITLELSDGSEHFLCFECVESLPEEPTADEVAALPERQNSTEVAPPVVSGLGVLIGIVGAVLFGVVGGLLLADTTTGIMVGGAIGVFLGLLVDYIHS